MPFSAKNPVLIKTLKNMKFRVFLVLTLGRIISKTQSAANVWVLRQNWDFRQNWQNWAWLGRGFEKTVSFKPVYDTTVDTTRVTHFEDYCSITDPSVTHSCTSVKTGSVFAECFRNKTQASQWWRCWRFLSVRWVKSVHFRDFRWFSVFYVFSRI